MKIRDRFKTKEIKKAYLPFEVSESEIEAIKKDADTKSKEFTIYLQDKKKAGIDEPEESVEAKLASALAVWAEIGGDMIYIILRLDQYVANTIEQYVPNRIAKAFEKNIENRMDEVEAMKQAQDSIPEYKKQAQDFTKQWSKIRANYRHAKNITFSYNSLALIMLKGIYGTGLSDLQSGLIRADEIRYNHPIPLGDKEREYKNAQESLVANLKYVARLGIDQDLNLGDQPGKAMRELAHNISGESFYNALNELLELSMGLKAAILETGLPDTNHLINFLQKPLMKIQRFELNANDIYKSYIDSLSAADAQKILDNLVSSGYALSPYLEASKQKNPEEFANKAPNWILKYQLKFYGIKVVKDYIEPNQQAAGILEVANAFDNVGGLLGRNSQKKIVDAEFADNYSVKEQSEAFVNFSTAVNKIAAQQTDKDVARPEIVDGKKLSELLIDFNKTNKKAPGAILSESKAEQYQNFIMLRDYLTKLVDQEYLREEIKEACSTESADNDEKRVVERRCVRQLLRTNLGKVPPVEQNALNTLVDLIFETAAVVERKKSKVKIELDRKEIDNEVYIRDFLQAHVDQYHRQISFDDAKRIVDSCIENGFKLSGDQRSILMDPINRSSRNPVKQRQFQAQVLSVVKGAKKIKLADILTRSRKGAMHDFEADAEDSIDSNKTTSTSESSVSTASTGSTKETHIHGDPSNILEAERMIAAEPIKLHGQSKSLVEPEFMPPEAQMPIKEPTPFVPHAHSPDNVSSQVTEFVPETHQKKTVERVPATQSNQGQDISIQLNPKGFAVDKKVWTDMGDSFASLCEDLNAQSPSIPSSVRPKLGQHAARERFEFKQTNDAKKMTITENVEHGFPLDKITLENTGISLNVSMPISFLTKQKQDKHIAALVDSVLDQFKHLPTDYTIVFGSITTQEKAIEVKKIIAILQDAGFKYIKFSNDGSAKFFPEFNAPKIKKIENRKFLKGRE